MAKSARSSKAKGRRLQNYVRDILRDVYPQLHPDDIKSQTMGMSGEDIVRSPAAKEVCAFSFECKNVERLQIWRAIEQCEANKPDCSAPAIVFKKNGKQPYVALPFTVFCDMLQYENEERLIEQTQTTP
tara:strand:- start:168 stop:554 length:387 start_codon:yes stop_codon:yes gene_type:complete